MEDDKSFVLVGREGTIPLTVFYKFLLFVDLTIVVVNISFLDEKNHGLKYWAKITFKACLDMQNIRTHLIFPLTNWLHPLEEREICLAGNPIQKEKKWFSNIASTLKLETIMVWSWLNSWMESWALQFFEELLLRMIKAKLPFKVPKKSICTCTEDHFYFGQKSSAILRTSRREREAFVLSFHSRGAAQVSLPSNWNQWKNNFTVPTSSQSNM